MLVVSYYQCFDNIDLQERITDIFLPLLPDITGQYQAKALGKFYEMYFVKDNACERNID